MRRLGWQSWPESPTFHANDGIIARFSEQDISLILVLPPCYERFLDYPEEVEHLTGLKHLYSDLASVHSHVYFPDPTIPAFPIHILSKSIDHLTRERASVLTKKFAGEVFINMDRPR